MGAMQRNKGRRAEQLIVNRLKEHGFDRAARNLSQTRDSGYDITGLEPFAIEIKDHKKLNVSQWWQQTTDNAAGDLIPCLIYHIPNTSRWMVQLPMSVINSELCSNRTVTVDFEDFIYVAREIVA
ncbi:hypothetical protein MNB_SV-4-1288 [hydrothermal vent metagenome]|uniref:Holliday junction resolvase n=1 Tax=hydrothermal vent metagenome TaxID=652676 RepID=A0A1W1E894_9ZZZZ